MPKFHRIAAFCVLAAAAAWIATGEFTSVGSAQGKAEGAAAEPAGEPATVQKPVVRTVAAMTPAFVDYARTIRLSGITVADKRTALAARADGVINGLTLAKGAKVSAGDVVMILEGAEAEALAKIAEITLSQRESDLERAERLLAGGNVPEIEVTNARSAREQAAAELARAEAALDKQRLVAPFDGIVDTLDVELGEWVQTGTPVATILALDPIVVMAEVSELDLASVTVGARASVQLVTGAELAGTVRLVAREASAQTRTFPVEIALSNPDLALSAGMTAEVFLSAAPVRAVEVPRSVITLSETGALGLRVVGADSLAAFAPVTIVDDTPEGLMVTGVPEGMRIITAGQDLVRDGDMVEVVAAESIGQ